MSNTTRYIATIRANNGNEYMVLPVGKRTTHTSVESAVRRLESRGRSGMYGQGRVYDTARNLVYTIAL